MPPALHILTLFQISLNEFANRYSHFEKPSISFEAVLQTFYIIVISTKLFPVYIWHLTCINPLGSVLIIHTKFSNNVKKIKFCFYCNITIQKQLKK